MRLLSPIQRRRPSIFRRYYVVVALFAVLGASLLTLTNAPRVLACPVCISPDKITLAGDGVIGTVSVTDPGLLAWFSTALFMGFEQRVPIEPPIHTGVGVELTRYYQNTGVPASFWTQGFDHMRYYPGAAGHPGYIYYEGPVSEEARTYAQGLDLWQRVGKWYALTSAENTEVSQLMGAANANPQNSSADSPPPLTSPDAQNTSGPSAILRVRSSVPLPVIILVVCLALLVASVGYRLLRPRRHRAPFAPAEDAID